MKNHYLDLGIILLFLAAIFRAPLWVPIAVAAALTIPLARDTHTLLTKAHTL